MTDPETPEEAYERLRRETRLGEQIRWLKAGLGKLRLCVLSTPEVMLLIDQLRELRARRIAMGREPDDEVNAAADLACPACGDLDGDCRCLAAAMEVEIWDASGPPTVREKVDEAIRRVRSCEPTVTDPFDAGASLRARPAGWRPNPDFVPRPEPKTAHPVMMLSPGEALGPRLRCGAFRLRECGGLPCCGALCEPADEAFPF